MRRANFREVQRAPRRRRIRGAAIQRPIEENESLVCYTERIGGNIPGTMEYLLGCEARSKVTGSYDGCVGDYAVRTRRSLRCRQRWE